MKARIFVTLMIALSMCMVCTATSENPYQEGYSDGIDNGYSDAKNGLCNDFERDLNNPYPGEDPYTYYKNGYRDGYNVGYDNGCADDTDLEPTPVISKPADKDDLENCMSSPALGLGFKYPNGTVTQRGDHVPTLYTWAEVDDKYEHHTTLTFPAEGTYTGCVIITLPQIAGEPLVPSGFWDTAKGQRILQWKANAG